MESITYHSFADKYQKTIFACSRKSEKNPLMINCAGTTVVRWTFKTQNLQGRADYYFLYLKTGSLNMTIANDEHTIYSGTLVLIPPNTPYIYQHVGNDELVYYWIHFTGSHAAEILRNFDLTPLPFISALPQVSSAVDYQMTKIFDTYIKGGRYRDYELSHCMDAILLDIAKHYEPSGNEYKKLSRSIRYINSNYTSDLKVPELAEMEFLSVSRYTTLFKEIMHISPYQYIIGLRINAACEMLRDSDLSVTKIAELLGFQNCFFFSKLFKVHMGISPTQYKKNKSVLQKDL